MVNDCFLGLTPSLGESWKNTNKCKTSTLFNLLWQSPHHSLGFYVSELGRVRENWKEIKLKLESLAVWYGGAETEVGHGCLKLRKQKLRIFDAYFLDELWQASRCATGHYDVGAKWIRVTAQDFRSREYLTGTQSTAVSGRFRKQPNLTWR